MNKKKLLTYLIISVLAAALCGCISRADTTAEDSKLKVIASNFAAFDFARYVGGDKVQTSMLLAPGSESHTYDPTPQDIISIDKCDVFIYTGGESDTWVDKVLSSIDVANKHVIKMTDCVSLLAEEEVGVEGHHHDHSDSGEDHDHDDSDEDHDHSSSDEDHDHDDDDEDHDHDEETEWDEHVWMSLENAKIIEGEIVKALKEVDPDNSAYYDDNLNRFKTECDRYIERFTDAVAKGKRQSVVFADRFPARYFVEEFGLEYKAAFPGCSENTEASSATVGYIIDSVREGDYPYVFITELSSGKLAQTVSSETGVGILTFYTGHNVTAKDFEDGVTYFILMDRNLDSLGKALN